MKKTFSLLLVICVIFLTFSLSACGNTGVTTTTAKPAATTGAAATTTAAAGTTAAASNETLWKAIDTSKAAKITMFVVATQPVAIKEVMALVNTKLQAKINTTLDLNFISQSDRATKYPLMLAGGDDLDLIYTASWCYYKESVDKGAFKELSKDFIAKNMPVTSAQMAPIAWDQIAVNGKIYAIPRSDASLFALRGAMVRKDLQAKYGITDINTYADYEKYLLAVADKEKASGMYAFYQSPAQNLQQFFVQDQNWQTVSNYMYWDADKKLSTDSLFFIYDTPEFKQYFLKMAQYAKANVWPSNAITGTTGTNELFLEQKSASKVANYYNDDKVIKVMRTKGVEVEFYNIFPSNYLNKSDAYAGDAMAIPAFSKQPERAATCLDVIKYDKEINTLLTGGIEGRHYIYHAADNTYETGKEASNYPWDGWSWGIRAQFMPSAYNKEPCIIQAEKENAANKMPETMWPFNGFYFDTKNVSSEYAVISSLVSEYLPSLNFGVFGDNVEAKYNEFIAKLKAAGLDKFEAEYCKQAIK